MNKTVLVIGIIFLLVGVSVIPSTVGIIDKKSTVRTLIYNGYIQDLIDNASDGNTINIPSGTYYENIIIDKSINLIGEDKDTTIIDGERKGHVVQIKKDGVTISGFTIQRSDSWGSQHSGLRIESDNNLIQNNNIIRNGHGILLDGFTNSIEIYNNIIRYNNIKLNKVGITLSDGCSNNIIYKNNINNNSYHGIDIDNMGGPAPCNNIISNNNINYNGNSEGVGTGIYTHRAGPNQIVHNNIKYNAYGLHLFLTNGLKIKYNNIIGNDIDADFFACIYQRWGRNYWNEPMSAPKKIHGIMIIRWPGYYKELPCFNIDWLPAKKPYDITTTHGCGIE